MNTYTPSRYDERVFHLALGIEPREAIGQQRLPASVDVRLEQFPRPVEQWRRWLPGETLTSVLPRLHRHGSGRFVQRYDQRVQGRPLASPATLRIVDDRRSGRLRVAGEGRTIVPRRVRVSIAAANGAERGEPDPAIEALTAAQRTYPLGCFPGSSAGITSHATVLRGSVVRQVDGVDVPVRWVRVRADTLDGETVGWAHGDDRGEFVLLIESGADAIAMPPDPLRVAITIGARTPPAEPDPNDLLLSLVDPLWDLPIEDLPSGLPATDPVINGRRFLPGHTVASPIANNPLDLAHGRETSRQFRIP